MCAKESSNEEYTMDPTVGHSALCRGILGYTDAGYDISESYLTPEDLEEKTDLDEFFDNYRTNTMCMLHILTHLDFDEDGYNMEDDTPDDAFDTHPLVKRVYPRKGFCIRSSTKEGCVVFINICHCNDVQQPSDALLNTLLNMSDCPPLVELPLSLGRPHRELDIDGQICIAFDVIVNSTFYKRQMVRYELLRAFVLTLCLTGINNKYFCTIEVDTCAKLLDRRYHGTMPKQYIDRRLSAYEKDRIMAFKYMHARTARSIKRAVKSALKLRLLRRRRYRSLRINTPERWKSRRAPPPEPVREPSPSRMRTRSYRPTTAPDTLSNLQARFLASRREEIDTITHMEYLDMGGIFRIGIAETDHRPHPRVLPPGSMSDSVDLLNNLKYDDPGYSLDYDLYQLCDDSPEYLAAAKLPRGTNLEEVAIFASKDGIVVCDFNSKRYFEIGLPYPIVPNRIKVAVKRLNMRIYIPAVPPVHSRRVQA